MLFPQTYRCETGLVTTEPVFTDILKDVLVIVIGILSVTKTTKLSADKLIYVLISELTSSRVSKDPPCT